MTQHKSTSLRYTCDYPGCSASIGHPKGSFASRDAPPVDTGWRVFYIQAYPLAHYVPPNPLRFDVCPAHLASFCAELPDILKL